MNGVKLHLLLKVIVKKNVSIILIHVTRFGKYHPIVNLFQDIVFSWLISWKVKKTRITVFQGQILESRLLYREELRKQNFFLTDIENTSCITQTTTSIQLKRVALDFFHSIMN